MTLLTQNTKMRKSKDKRTFNFGIPAFQSASGFKTCPNAAACAKGCYARSGAYRFSNVAKAFEERLAFTQKPVKAFVKGMSAEIKRVRAERVRIHDSGDFYSQEYLYKWVRVMQENPNVQFYAYTKQVSLFKANLIRLPENFTLIFSYGGKQDKLIDQSKDRHSRVFETLEELEAAGYANAMDDDAVALGSNPKIGLVYHGSKNFQNTDWSKVK